MDRFRVMALENLLKLKSKNEILIIEMLLQKYRLLLKGAIKYDKMLDIKKYKEKIEFYKKSAKHYSAIKLWITLEKNGQKNIAWNKEKPIFNQSITKINDEKWFYYDRFYRNTIEYIFANVSYSSAYIKDPFRDNSTSIEKAHMWWRIKDDGDFLVFETANATENREIKLRQHSAIASIERTSGRVTANVQEDDGIAYTRLYLPKFSYFFRRKK